MRGSAGRTVLLAGCSPEVAAADGRIIAVGPSARSAAGAGAEVHQLWGTAWPGLVDAHVHLQWLAQLELTLDLTRTHGVDDALTRIRARAGRLAAGAFLIGRGWTEGPPAGSRPHRRLLDEAGGGRPVLLRRRDGHSVWVSSAVLRRAAITRQTADPPGGVIERDENGEPTGILRETAIELVERVQPSQPEAEVERALLRVLNRMAAVGLTGVHSIDPVQTFALLQRLRERSPLPLRVTYNFPVTELDHLERVGIRSGWGDAELRVWGVKAFLDGSLGSGTAEMLDGTGVTVTPQPELREIVRRTAAAELNVCLHAIGDGAVRRALDALVPFSAAWRSWRPRIEHAQCVARDDMRRFRAAGAVASMQPIHAVADREMADREWGRRVAQSYAWRALAEAGAVLAFGSDAPIEDFDPLQGIRAATSWRRQAKWHPELALTRAAAVRAYTRGAAYAVGLERELGSLRPGFRCDVTVVDEEGVVAAVVGGRITFRRRMRRAASARSGPGAR